MQLYAAFHLGFHCLQKYPYRGFQNTKGLALFCFLPEPIITEGTVCCMRILAKNLFPPFQVTRVVLLWVNNHFNDFETNADMCEFLEHFEQLLEREVSHVRSSVLSMSILF